MTLCPINAQFLACGALLLSTANAQWWLDGDGNGGYNGYRPPWWDDNNNNNDNAVGIINYFTRGGGRTAQRALIAHAVIASVVWVLLIPSAGILLRLNLTSPWILRVHAVLQIVSYLLYIAAAGLGIWLLEDLNFLPYFNLWDDPHAPLGLTILALAFFQPILGAVHHRIFKKRMEDAKSGNPNKPPGRTIPGHMHLWLGRILIVLGIVNGGLGIRLADRTPFQSYRSTKTAAIVYGVVAAVVAIIYLLVVIQFETKSRRDREAKAQSAAGVATGDVPPTYVQSQESLQKGPTSAVRYT